MNNLFETFGEALNPIKKQEQVVKFETNEVEAYVTLNGIYQKGWNFHAEDYAITEAKNYAYDLRKKLNINH